jgi:glycosyltransferase involved in cell wall biosynthesis
MFAGQSLAPALAGALDAAGIEPLWDAPVIAADTVILHNPAFLKFDKTLGRRIVARELIVVTHENFQRPGGAEGFDVAGCLDRIDRGTVALRKTLAPVSAHNRVTVTDWVARNGVRPGWSVAADDWFNICDFPLTPPTDAPRDRRGRHSRPGFEKFPPRAVLDLCFPRHAEANVILGAEVLMAEEAPAPHWQLHPFRGLDLERYFGMIDFMVYFTAPTWQESFGRVLAEAIAAGKVVISDAATAAGFAGAVVPARPEEVDALIRGFIADPGRYASQVRRAQATLSHFSAEAFRARFAAATGLSREVAA